MVDNRLDTILPTIVLIVVIVTVGWLFIILLYSGFRRNPGVGVLPNDKLGNTTTTVPQVVCTPGQCLTNISSGFKTCPSRDIPIDANPLTEVCNGRYVCDNPLTPFAKQSDGSTNLNGECECISFDNLGNCIQRVECPCLKVAQCPDYILSVFTKSNGNPFASSNGQRLTFPQEATYVSTDGIATTVPPIQYSDPSTTFCTAPADWLPLANPGCNFVSLAGSSTMSPDDVLLCMGMASGCSGLDGSPCLQGVLAVVTDNPEGVFEETITSYQFGCVRGTPCPCNQVAIFDTRFGGTICQRLVPEPQPPSF